MLWQTAATERELARRLHPRLISWFRQSFQNFTHAQLLAVPAILDRRSCSIMASAFAFETS
jgi:Lhr-like helicase